MVKASADKVSESEEEEGRSSKNRFRIIHLIKSKHNLLKVLFQVLLAFFSIILALVIIEVSLRVFEKKQYTLDPCTSLDRDFHHVLVPNSTCRFKSDEWDVLVKINSQGLRNDEISQEKPDSTFRILALGDSFTMGHGVNVEDAYTNVLEDKLSQFSNKKVAVINAAVFGYSPILDYLYLKKKGLQLHPDLVVLFFTLTDFWDDRRRFEELRLSYPELESDELSDKIASAEVEFNFNRINSGGNPTVVTAEALPGVSDNLKQWLRRNFKVYATVADFVKKKNKVVQQDVIYQGDIDRDIVALIRGAKISDSSWEELWKEPIANLKLMNHLLKENNIPFVVVMIPDAFQVSDSEWPNRKALGISSHFEDTRASFQEELVRRMKGEEIQFIDLLPKFKDSKNFPLYFSNDGHFRESGHKLTSEVVFEEIKNYVKK